MQWRGYQSCAAVAVMGLLYLTALASAARSYRKEILDTVLGGNFSSFVRPVEDDTHTTQVSMRMSLYQIRELDEKYQKLTVKVWINLFWHDDFLEWDPNEFGNVTSIHLPSSKIWRPDIAMYNSVDEEKPSTEVLSDTLVIVLSTGHVNWSVPAIIKSACRVDIADYPFDTQRCPLKFGSWTYNGFELNLTSFADTAMLDKYEGNGEWILVGVPCEREEILYTICPEPYPVVTFTVVMKRRPMFYLFHLLFPCVLLTAIGLMMFCLPPESGEKVSLAVTVLLSMTFFMLVIKENIPPTSEVVSLFEQYFGVTILLLALTTVGSVMVMNVHFRGLRGHRPPAWVRKLFLDWLARFVFMHKMANASPKLKSRDCYLPITYNPRGPDAERHIMRKGSANTLTSRASSSVTLFAANHVNNAWMTNEADKDYSSCGTPPKELEDPALGKILDLLKQQRRRSSQETRRDGYDEETEVAMAEWQSVAMVADRVMFVVFTLVTLIVTTALFGGAPA